MATPKKETADQWVTVKVPRTTHERAKRVAKSRGMKLGEVFARATTQYANRLKVSSHAWLLAMPWVASETNIQDQDAQTVAGVVTVFLVVFFLWGLPVIMACSMSKAKTGSVVTGLLLGLFLGWLGWLITLLMPYKPMIRRRSRR